MLDALLSVAVLPSFIRKCERRAIVDLPPTFRRVASVTVGSDMVKRCEVLAKT